MKKIHYYSELFTSLLGREGHRGAPGAGFGGRYPRRTAARVDLALDLQGRGASEETNEVID